jgi:signal recognition particle subunit SRP54
MTKTFASQGDLQAKRITFDRLSEHAYAYTAEGDPNTGIVIGDDGVLVADTQATPVMAADVIRRIREVTDKPIKFIGVGEKIEDLEPFYPERIASRILGMGDVVSLVEKAQQAIDQKEAEELRYKIQSASFTLADFLEQFQRMRKLGSLQSLVEMIPGLSGQLKDQELDEKELKHQEAIILSMTPEERENYRIIGPSRRKRIARGSGTSVFEVNQLLKRFEKTRLMMKKMSQDKKMQAQMFSHSRG